ncbi:MAG: lipid A deacylase LpxR family protein [Xanthomonadales bacterium]|nr:lipid A deacylase LpxR family protein [Xanthomonadales bacterium]MBN8795187.1 lipid A deacylase LpxR family protein [Stenotrophomonas nitritireducens]
MKRAAFAIRRLLTGHRGRCSLLWLGMQCVFPATQAADAPGEAGCRPEQTLRWRGGTLRLENDLFAGTDRNYTNGVAIALVSHDLTGRLRPECLPRPLGLYTRFLGWVDPGFWNDAGAASATQNVVVRFGQAMYTPEDKARSDLIPDDRPYAGLLYLGLAWNRRIRPRAAPYEMLDTRELTLGVIGPLSLAEQAQNLVHDLRGIDRFNGWNNQLHNEPALQVAWERKFRPDRGDAAVQAGWSTDAIGSYALRLGNIETAASAGFELRAGWNIPNDFGSYPIRPGAENRPPSAAADLREVQPQSPRAPRPGAHAFVNVEAKAVAWDFSLDGNLFGASHHVTRRPWVTQAALGLSSQWLLHGHGVRLALMRVWRSREFEEQRGHHTFGSVALSVEF